MRYCPECGYEYKPEIRDCPDCGTEILEFESETCEVCQEETADHQTFCTHCGNFVSGPRKLQFVIKTQERDVVAACCICGDWIHEGHGKKEGTHWFCDADDHYQVYEDWVVLKVTSQDFQAHFLKAALDSASIPAMIFNQKDSSYVTTAGDLAIIKIMVPKDHLAEAEEILTELNQHESEQEE